MEPLYSTMAEADTRLLCDLVARNGYTQIIAGIADILTQDGPDPDPEFSFSLGFAMADAQRVDRERRSRSDGTHAR
jgi:hypothetical protein